MKYYYQAFVIDPATFDVTHKGIAKVGEDAAYKRWLSVNKEIEWTDKEIEWTDDADGMWVLIAIDEEGKVVY